MAEAGARRGRRSRGWIFSTIVAIAAVLIFNWQIVDAKVRAAVPRDGGVLIETDVATANVKVEGNGPAIVMIHGFSAGIDWWDKIAPDLARDHRVVCLDLIGHGGTVAPHSGYTIERQAALVGAVLDKLGIAKSTVIGHSMGGEVATALTEARPALVERLILIDSPATADAEFTLATQAYLTPILGEAMSRVLSDKDIRVGLAQGFAPSYPMADSFVADLRQLPFTAFKSAHEESIAFRTAKPTYLRLAAIKPAPPPLLAITGLLDAIVPPASAKLYEQVPGSHLEVVEGSGHSPIVEKPEKTLELIRAFLPAQ
jgi:pimeloyl-ACP methyl ester carboxylesterase